MLKYHVATSGYDGYVTMSKEELTAYVNSEVKRARRYFKTAVKHVYMPKESTSIYYQITARRDKNSASWINITAHKH